MGIAALMLKSMFIAGLAAVCSVGAASAQSQCLTDSDARSEVQTRKLVSVQHAISTAREKGNGELLSAHLCHLPGGFVYRISIIGRDGRVARFLVNATNGRFPDQ